MTYSFSHILYVIADQLSESINPMLLALILQEPLLSTCENSTAFPVVMGTAHHRMRNVLRFYLQAIFAVGLALLLAEMGKKYQVWSGHNNFPSGHTTFAAAAATCIIVHRGWQWAWFVVPLVFLMAASLAYGKWHTVDEVVAAMVLGPVVAFIIMRITRRKQTA